MFLHIFENLHFDTPYTFFFFVFFVTVTALETRPDSRGLRHSADPLLTMGGSLVDLFFVCIDQVHAALWWFYFLHIKQHGGRVRSRDVSFRFVLFRLIY